MNFLEIIIQTITDMTESVKELFNFTSTPPPSIHNENDIQITKIKDYVHKDEHIEGGENSSLLTKLTNYIKSFFKKKEIITPQEYNSKYKEYTTQTFREDMGKLLYKERLEKNTLNKFGISLNLTYENRDKFMKQNHHLNNVYSNAIKDLQDNSSKYGVKLVTGFPKSNNKEE
jgi:hypothetical protein